MTETEKKPKALNKVTRHNTMMEKSLFWVPCEFCQWSCGKELLDEKQSNKHIRGTYSYPNWLFGCSAWGTEPISAQQVQYVGIQEEDHLECFKSYDIYKKIFSPFVEYQNT